VDGALLSDGEIVTTSVAVVDEFHTQQCQPAPTVPGVAVIVTEPDVTLSTLPLSAAAHV
jgi:hypothetical protein